MATKQQVNEFIRKMANACTLTNMGGLFPSVAIAQAAVESGWGTTLLARKYNNFFGIKALGGWTGKSVNLSTGEILDGQKVTIKSNFRVYDSMRASLADRNKFLNSYSRYKSVVTATTPEAQIKALGSSGYATATSYTNAIMSIYKQYNLQQYDSIVKKKRIAMVVLTIFAGLIIFKIKLR